MNSALILVVDDEAIVREVVERYLTRDGYTVMTASDGESAMRHIQKRMPDLVVLDLMLPGVDGLEVTRRLRAASPVPIIMLTARGEETDKILGLRIGADDYLVKPFSPRELVARVEAVLRRAGNSDSAAARRAAVMRFDGLVVDPRAHTVEVGGRPVELTIKEFDLLTFLASNPNQVFSREQLLDKVWDYSYAGDASTVTVHMRRLRSKVEATPERPRHLKTVWGAGYKFEP